MNIKTAIGPQISADFRKYESKKISKVFSSVSKQRFLTFVFKSASISANLRPRAFWSRAGVFGPLLLLALAPAPAFAYSSPSDDTTKGILFCAAGIIGGIVAFFWGFFQLRTKRLMEDIPLSTIRAMAPGLVEINGSAVDWKLLEGPMTQEKCVYYEYLIEQYVSSGKNSHWETILRGNSKEHPFYVQDDTGTVRVEPQDSKVIIPHDFRLETGMFTDVPANIESFMDQKGLSCRSFFGFQKKLRFTEHNLKPAEKVFVMGTCQQSLVRPPEPPTGAADEVCVGRSQDSGDVFIVSDQSQRDLESSYGTHAFFGIFGGLALIGGCLYGLLSLLGAA